MMTDCYIMCSWLVCLIGYKWNYTTRGVNVISLHFLNLKLHCSVLLIAIVWWHYWKKNLHGKWKMVKGILFFLIATDCWWLFCLKTDVNSIADKWWCRTDLWLNNCNKWTIFDHWMTADLSVDSDLLL